MLTASWYKNVVLLCLLGLLVGLISTETHVGVFKKTIIFSNLSVNRFQSLQNFGEEYRSLLGLKTFSSSYSHRMVSVK